MKSSIERRMEIVNIVGLQGKARVEELAKLFNVSGSTIRADFRFLESGGFIVRSHGIAIINKGAVTQFAERKVAQPAPTVKPVIKAVVGNENIPVSVPPTPLAALLYGQLNCNETVYIDGSPYISQLVGQLPALGKLVVLTNSINVMNTLVVDTDKQVILPGGIVDPATMTLTGSQVETSLRRYRVNKAILSVDGFSSQMGYFAKSEFAADIAKVITDIAQEVIIVVPSQALAENSNFWVGDKNMASTVITDSGIDSTVRAELEHCGIKVLVA